MEGQGDQGVHHLSSFDGDGRTSSPLDIFKKTKPTDTKFEGTSRAAASISVSYVTYTPRIIAKESRKNEDIKMLANF